MPSTRARCEKCGRRFQRLDTHLRVSYLPRCRKSNGTPGCHTLYVPPTAISNLHATLPGNLNSMLETAAAVATTIETATLETHLSATSSRLDFKNPLKLPKSPEEWEEADYLLSSVTSSVLQASTAEEKNNCLCAGIYNILSYRFGTRAPPRPQKPSIRQHDRALKEVTRLKNKARRALRKAKREGASDDVIQPLAANFLSLLRRHSRLCRESSSRLRHKEAKDAREECNRNFAKNLLGKGCTAQTPPAFTASAAHSFFSDVYQSSTHQFSSPSWMPSAPLPTPGCAMEMTPTSEEELARVIRKSKPSSAPSPADRIPYLIFKKCHSLRPALLDLFNRVIMEGSVLLSWKVAVIKLIPKSSAQEDQSSPGNFRSIALTLW